MDSKRLNELWNELITKEQELIGVKAGEYANNDERLWNFIEGAQMQMNTPKATAWSYLTKQIISIKKACLLGSYMFCWAVKQKDGTYTEGIVQKIADARNYLFFVLCCLEEEAGKKAEFTTE